MTPELLPCPFCGELPAQVIASNGQKRVRCETISCPMEGWNNYAAKWNTRAEGAAMLTWTTEPPKVPGWYWHKNCLGTTIMDLRRLKDVKLTQVHGWQWSGPIPEPVDAEQKNGE